MEEESPALASEPAGAVFYAMIYVRWGKATADLERLEISGVTRRALLRLLKVAVHEH